MFSECAHCLLPGPASLAVKLLILPVFLVVMLGRVVLAARKIQDKKLRNRVAIAIPPIALILFLLVPLALTADFPERYSPLAMQAPPFEWPAGCAPRAYNIGDGISMACKNWRNAMPKKLTLEHGFPGQLGRGEMTYYRVGDDAVMFSCIYWNINTCTVRQVVRNVFHS
jgi:hypothetical protein